MNKKKVHKAKTLLLMNKTEKPFSLQSHEKFDMILRWLTYNNLDLWDAKFWGLILTRGSSPITCISEFFNHSITFLSKKFLNELDRKKMGHNFSYIHGRHNLGASFWPERQTLQLILFKSFIIPLRFVVNWEKLEMHYNNKRWNQRQQQQNTIFRSHEQALVRSWLRNWQS